MNPSVNGITDHDAAHTLPVPPVKHLPDSTQKKKADRKKIDRRKMYLFGPAHRGQEQELNEGERVQFLSTTENGINYPCEYQGSYFIDTLGVRSFDDYLRQNPEGLKAGRRFFFYERDEDGSDTLVASGTMMPKAQGMRLGDSEGIAVPVTSAVPASPTIVVQPQQQDQHGRRIVYEEMLEALREELEQLRAQNTTLHLRIESLQRDMIEAERRALAAESMLQIERERATGELASVNAAHTREITALSERHEMEMTTQQQLHDQEKEIMTIRAAEERQLAVQDAQLAEQEAHLAEYQARMAEERRLADTLPPAESPESDMLTMLTQVMPLAQPVLATLGDAVRSWIDGWMTERRLRLREMEDRMNRRRQIAEQQEGQQDMERASRDGLGRTSPGTPYMNDPLNEPAASHATRSRPYEHEARRGMDATHEPVGVDANTLFTMPNAQGV